MILLKDINIKLKEKLDMLLKDCPRFDITMESILEGQSGNNIKIFVDNVVSPTAVVIIQGTFIIFAGDADSEIATEMIKSLPPHYGIQPTNEKFISLAKNMYKENLKSSRRFIFSSEDLNKDSLKEIIYNSEYKEYLKRIDLNTANKMNKDKLNRCHLFNYNSPEDFIKNSFGFCIEKDSKILSACTASLLSKNSAEISIITDPCFRKKGLATVVAARFILYCLENNLTPHWDAANYTSYTLAQKLGYKYIDEYNIYYINSNKENL